MELFYFALIIIKKYDIIFTRIGGKIMYIGMALIAIIGTSLHFLYEMSGHNKFVGIFAAVNESTWEHIKIGMTPTILWSLYDGYIYGQNANYLIAKGLSLLVIILLIPILFYTYTFFTKKSILWIDVICFYLTVICSQFIFYQIISLEPLPFLAVYLSSILMMIEISCYTLLTYQPLNNFIFEDPITHKYGLAGHTHFHHHSHNHHQDKED